MSGMSYPVLTLPVEITTQIFLHCLPVTSSSSVRDKGSPLQDIPILLTTICRDWRIIALSTPQLWRHFHFVPDVKRGLRPGYIDSWWVKFLERWLYRAQNHPLSLVISTHAPNEALFGLLDSCRAQWEDVTLKLPFDQFSQFSTHAAIPMLRRLGLDAHNIPRVLGEPIMTFEHAPLLTHVRLEGWLRPFHVNLPWVQLTTLELASASPKDCVECLRRTPRLVNCILEILETQDGNTPSAPLPAHALLYLHSLTLTGQCPSAILPYVLLPALENLDLASRSIISGDLSNTYFCVSRSGCQLRRLRLHFISRLLEQQAIELLEALSSLESLELAATEATTLTSIFVRLKDQSGFLPQLRNLSLTHHKMCDENLYAMFDDMTAVLVRRKRPSPDHVQLRSFCFFMQHEETPPGTGAQLRWQELVHGGMSLSIRNRYERWV